MGLKSDIDEIHLHWSKYSNLGKAYLLLSGFLAVSSVASISDSVIKWRGFFKVGIDFYHEYISAPISDTLLIPIGIHLNPLARDILFVAALLFGSLIRYIILTKTLYESSEKYYAMMFSAIILLPICFALIIYLTNNKSLEDVRNAAQLLIVPALLMLPALLRMQRSSLYFIQIAFVLFTVSALAAINQGLTSTP